MVMTTTSAERLLARVARGDRMAFSELYERYASAVYGACLRVLREPGAAEDAAQDALLDIARGIGGLRNPDVVRIWALRVATLRAYKVARRERLLALRRAPAVTDELAIRPRDSHAVALKDAFDRLPPRMRAVAVLRLYAGLSEEDAAYTLGCSVGAIKSQLHEARRRLARTLTSQGVVPVTQQAHRAAS